MAKRWYVIRAVSGRENAIKELIQSQLRSKHLEGYVEEMLVPAERITEVKRGKKVSSERKLYPGYIYIQMEVHQPVLDVINEVEGVTGFLGADPRNPDALTADEAERIVRIATAQSPDEQRQALVQIPFNLDDRVKVKEGTFAGMEGVVAEINAQKGEMRVMITVFGRQTPVWLEVWQAESAV
jgi:transcriptional antiterminator NusG